MVMRMLIPTTDPLHPHHPTRPPPRHPRPAPALALTLLHHPILHTMMLKLLMPTIKSPPMTIITEAAHLPLMTLPAPRHPHRPLAPRPTHLAAALPAAILTTMSNLTMKLLRLNLWWNMLNPLPTMFLPTMAPHLRPHPTHLTAPALAAPAAAAAIAPRPPPLTHTMPWLPELPSTRK